MLLNFLRTIYVCFFLVTGIDSSHFLGGTITWSVQNVSSDGAFVAIRITQTYSWTYVSGRCDNASIANNQPVSGSSGILTCSPSCPSGFGTLSPTPYCTDVSTLNGIAVGQRLDTVVIPAGSDFFLTFSGTAWNSQISGSSTWAVSSYINLVRRSDTNMFNNAPVASMMSPINIQVNQTTMIPVSVGDADGDLVRCRWASNNTSSGINECGSVCPPNSLPANTVLYSNCTIQMTGTTVGSMYAVTFVVEDFIDPTSTSPMSSVPVQFIVKVIAPPLCSIPPSTTLDGPSCITIKVNETFTSQLFAINNCGPNVSIVDIATLSFAGMYQSSIVTVNSSIYYKSLTWTPTINQLGYQIMCAMALSSQSTQSPQYCFTFYVTENGASTCPGASNNSTITPISATPASTTINWPIIASFGALVLLFAILYSACILRHYYKRSTVRHRLIFYDNASEANTSTLSPTLKQSQTAPFKDWNYTIADESVKKSTTPSIPSDNEKVDDIDVEQTFEPKVMYPRINTVQASFHEFKSSIEPSDTSSKIENDVIPVRNVSLPVQQMITESRVSQIETIDLPPTNTELQLISKGDINSIASSDIAQTELTNATQNKIKTSNISNISEMSVKKSRHTKVKRKKLSSIHVTIRNSSKLKY